MIIIPNSGGIHFKSAVSEGIVFFDENNILNGIFRDKENLVDGAKAIDEITKSLSNNTFSVAVYKIDPDKIHFWTNLQNMEAYYKNLSTEFTDLGGLVNKMRSERLTGYIEVFIEGGKESGLIFLNNGAIVGSSCSWEKGGLNNSEKNHETLIRKSRESGGIFNVSKISLTKKKKDIVPKTRKTETTPFRRDMIQELLNLFEKAVQENKKLKTGFDTLLKRKFMEKVDEYDFLDPFAAEFQYANGKVQYTGKAGSEQLARAVAECVGELADELGMQHVLSKNLVDWTAKYSNEIKKLNLDF
ncbi:MAG: hypothetical protein JRI61_05160 [Deltaproteobacteria bacterium]|nr:hypothetical protein [Deltaproteobacteria bacterium]